MTKFMTFIAERKGALLRGVLLSLGLANAVLAMYGKSPIPISEEQLVNLFSALWVVVSALWSYWKNNSLTSKAIIADGTLKALKEKDLSGAEETDEDEDLEVTKK